MPRIRTIILMAAVGALTGLTLLNAQESETVTLKQDPTDFIYFAGRTISRSVSVEGNHVASEKVNALLDSFSVSLKVLSTNVQELSEFRLEYLGVKYILPARKIIVVPPEATKQGVFVHAALDPNGTGNYEVLLTVNWPVWPDKDKRINLSSEHLPDTLKIVSNSAGWSNPNGGLSLTKTIILHNGTDQPFILKASHFENLPTTEGFPIIEIPPAN